ncbi:MAG: hypothetical protein OHK0013_01870 [Sandaracinaceae bacterium]
MAGSNEGRQSGELPEDVRQRIAAYSAKGTGRTYLNVGLCWPREAFPDAADWRIHAIRVPSHPSHDVVDWAADVEEFATRTKGAELELIVGAGYADRSMFGLLLVASDLVGRSYPEHGLLRHTALVDRANQEANAAWFYLRRGFRIEVSDVG